MTDISPWAGLAGTVLAAVLAFVFGRVQLGRTNEMEREEALRRRRVEVYASFCSAVVEYRRAQLDRWYERSQATDPRDAAHGRTALAQDVRARRAVAWGEYYQVLMICNDERVEKLAVEALRIAKWMKDAPDSDEVTRRSDQVHDAIHQFARVAGATVTTSRKQRAVGPPAGVAPHPVEHT